MAERFDPFAVDEAFEQQLRDLAGSARFPETPDFAELFRHDISAPPVPRAHRKPAARFLLAAAIALLIVGATLALIPDARHAVADWFDLPGLNLTVGDDTPTALPATPEPPLAAHYGPPVPRDAATAAVDFPLLLPDHPEVTGTPEIYLSHDASPVVLIAYPSSATLPVIGQGGEGLLLVEFRASSDSVWGMKQAGAANDIRVVRVAGVDALWVGGTHTLMIAPPTVGGTPIARQSANVLAWNSGGITYRLEADLPLDVMVTIAESLVPAT